MQLVDDAASCQAMCAVSCMNTEIRHRIYLIVVLGTRKEESGFPLTQKMETYWDEVAAEVAGIRAAGFDLDIPWETPDVNVIPGLKDRIERERAERETKNY